MNFLSDITWYQITIVCLVIVILFLLYSNYQCATKSCVVNVQREGFNKCPQNVNKKDQNEIVYYYASWCPHCKTFMPEWDRFEKHARDNLQWLKVTKIQCENENEGVCKQKGVEGYPTVIFYKDGKGNTYEGDRKFEALVDFVNKNK